MDLKERNKRLEHLSQALEWPKDLLVDLLVVEEYLPMVRRLAVCLQDKARDRLCRSPDSDELVRAQARWQEWETFVNTLDYIAETMREEEE